MFLMGRHRIEKRWSQRLRFSEDPKECFWILLGSRALSSSDWAQQRWFGCESLPELRDATTRLWWTNRLAPWFPWESKLQIRESKLQIQRKHQKTWFASPSSRSSRFQHERPAFQCRLWSSQLLRPAKAFLRLRKLDRLQNRDSLDLDKRWLSTWLEARLRASRWHPLG